MVSGGEEPAWKEAPSGITTNRDRDTHVMTHEVCQFVLLTRHFTASGTVQRCIAIDT